MDVRDRQHLEEILRIHTRRLNLLEEQKAKFGIGTSPEVLIEIEDTRTIIDQIQQTLVSQLPVEGDTLGPTSKPLNTSDNTNSEAQTIVSAPAKVYVVGSSTEEGGINPSIVTPKIYIRTSLSVFIITLLSAVIGWAVMSGVNSIILPPSSYNFNDQLLILSSVFFYLVIAQLLPYNFLTSIKYNLFLVFTGILLIPIITYFTGLNKSMPMASRYFANLVQSFGAYGIITKIISRFDQQRRIQEIK